MAEAEKCISRLQSVFDMADAGGSKSVGPPTFSGAQAHKMYPKLEAIEFDTRQRLKGNMRLLKVASFLEWEILQVYEDVKPSDCWDVAYDNVGQGWDSTIVLSWRWGEQKKNQRTPGWSPMTTDQFLELKALMRIALARRFQFLWVDWSCGELHPPPFS